MIRPIVTAVLMALLAAGCLTESRAPPRGLPEIAVIPIPAQMTRLAGKFVLRDGTPIVVASNPELMRIAHYLADVVHRTRGIELAVLAGDAAQTPGAIRLTLAARGGAVHPEEYQLDVRPSGVEISAQDPRGLFYGAVTLWQLATMREQSDGSVDLPDLHIEDAPQLPWRGFMLDVARHYMPPEFIKQMLDWMALHKLNTLHWHLTDDQGWRLQILKYPRLTEVGARGVSQGYYTQDEVRDIVRYAGERFITVVPEIDIPGHAQAAIAAYPALGTEGAPPGVSADWGVHTYLFNADEQTFGFLEDVLIEVMALFPGEYLHLGGDEAVKDRWRASPRVQQRMRELGVADETALQGYFVRRLERFLASHGRKLLGWDEILEGGLPPQATVMSWRGTKGALQAAQQGHDVVLATDPTLYLDHLQSDLPDEPPGRPSVITLADIYAFKPQGPRVLGAQLNAWTEHMRTPSRVQHNAFPRIAALAEILWSPPERLDWENFLHRLPAQFERYRRLGIDFADSTFAVRASGRINPARTAARVELANQVGRGEIHYTLTDAQPTLTSARYGEALQLELPATVKAATFLDGRRMSATRTQVFTRESLQRRSDDELRSCSNKLPLRLEDDAPAEGERAVFNIDILDPCWIFPQADLSQASGIAAAVGQLPFNFQVGDDVHKIPLRPPQTPDGELEVHLDGCSGERIAVLPLAAAVAHDAVTELPQTKIAPRPGRHDLCLYFTRPALEPMWALEWVQLLE